jgi:hypothetical protein
VCDTRAAERDAQTVTEEADKATYLMLNARNGFIKIGVSNNPVFREKTLQSEEPEVFLIATAPDPNLERFLHRQYAVCRRRGEWFQLLPEDVKEILGYGFEATEGREDYISAYSVGLDYWQWMKQKLISEWDRWNQLELQNNLDRLRDGEDPDVCEWAESLGYEEDVDRLCDYLDGWIEEGEQIQYA